MTLFEAVIDNADCEQLLAIKDRLSHLDQRVEQILPLSQFNVFLEPRDDAQHPQEIDIWVAIDGDLTVPQLTKLEEEVEATILTGQTVPTKPAPRIVEKLIRL